MLPPQDVAVYLNNALKATHELAELDTAEPLPETVAGMPDTVAGHFVSLEDPVADEMCKAYKRVMILNSTGVLYSFTYDPGTQTFIARKR